MKPRVFIGSSKEGLPIAEAIRDGLGAAAEVPLWSEGVFPLSSYTVEALLDEFRSVDFGVFVFSPDDETILRGESLTTARDNVILELGMSLGALGRKRSFIVRPEEIDLHLPSDLAGITVAWYDPSTADLAAAVSDACDQIQAEFASLAPAFPTESPFGPNVLADPTPEVLPGQEYGLAFEAPARHRVEVKLVLVGPPTNSVVPWKMSIVGMTNINFSKGGEDSQTFWNLGPGQAHTAIEFSESGEVQVTIFLDGEQVGERTIAW